MIVLVLVTPREEVVVLRHGEAFLVQVSSSNSRSPASQASSGSAQLLPPSWPETRPEGDVSADASAQESASPTPQLNREVRGCDARWEENKKNEGAIIGVMFVRWDSGEILV